LGTEQKQLQQLAQLYGLETSYYDIKGQHQQAEPDALFAVLRCLGLEIDNSGDVHNALRERKMERWQQCLEPVYTFFEGETPVLSVRLSAEQVNQMVYCKLELVETFQKVNGVKVPYEIVGRRPGDIAECYADASKAKEELGWTAKRGIREMCRDAWRWRGDVSFATSRCGAGTFRLPH
jgi:hypothetical protein